MLKMIKSVIWPIHQSYFVVALAVGVVVGTILGLGFRINYFSSPIWLAAVGITLIITFLKPRTVLIVFALFAGMIISFFRIAGELQGENYIRQLVNQTVVVTGTIDGDPNNDESGTKFKLRNLKFDGAETMPTAGTIYAATQNLPELHRADQVVIKGELMDGFGTYAGFFYKPQITKVIRPEPGDLVLRIRDWFADRISSKIDGPEGDLGLSYLLGMKTGLPEELSEDLRVVGLVHIVVASGAHLSILVEVARRIFGKISRFAGLLLSVGFIGFFMAMVGFTPSIMRAGIMAILGISAWYVGRKFAAWRIIILVAAITLVINPMYIIDLGWLLSFASFAGIMILSPKLSSFFFGDSQPKFIASTILVTVSATLMTLPITLYYFGTVSLISILANLLVLPTLPIAMGLTFLTGSLADVPLVNDGVSFLASKMLSFHITVVDVLAEAKSFLVEIEPYQNWVFLLYLPIVTVIAWMGWQKKRKQGAGKRMAGMGNVFSGIE